MIRWSPIIGLWVTRPLLYLGLYLAGKQLSKLPTTIILLKHVLETLCVPWVHGEIQRMTIMSLHRVVIPGNR